MQLIVATLCIGNILKMAYVYLVYIHKIYWSHCIDGSLDIYIQLCAWSNNARFSEGDLHNTNELPWIVPDVDAQYMAYARDFLYKWAGSFISVLYG